MQYKLSSWSYLANYHDLSKPLLLQHLFGIKYLYLHLVQRRLQIADQQIQLFLIIYLLSHLYKQMGFQFFPLYLQLLRRLYLQLSMWMCLLLLLINLKHYYHIHHLQHKYKHLQYYTCFHLFQVVGKLENIQYL